MSRNVFQAEVIDNAPIIGDEVFTKGELILKCEQLFGDEVTDPILPNFKYAGQGFGMFFIPPNGSTVDLAFDDDIDEPDLRWEACLYNFNNPVPLEFGNGTFPYRDAPGVPPVVRGANRYSRRMGMVFPSGLVMFDITEGDEHVWFHHKTGAGLEINKNGDLFLISKQDFDLQIDRNGLVKVTGDFVMEFVNLKLGGDAVTEPMPLGTALMTAINAFITGDHNTHTHPIPGVTPGPTTVTSSPPVAPAVPIPPASVLSAKIKGI